MTQGGEGASLYRSESGVPGARIAGYPKRRSTRAAKGPAPVPAPEVATSGPSYEDFLADEADVG